MKTSLAIICFPLAVLFMGCYTPHFLPNTAPVPMFDNAGNVRIAGYAGTNSYDVHVGISPIEHIGIVGAGSYSSSKKVDNEDNNKKPDNEAEFTHGHRYYEGALVYYFSPVNIKKDILKIEVLVGYGSGRANGSIDSGKRDILGFIVPTNRVDADYQQYYLQLNLGFNNIEFNNPSNFQSGAILEYGSVLRISQTKYSNFKKDGVTLKVDAMNGNFLQLGFFGSIGGSGTGLTIQGGLLYPITSDQNRPSYSPFFISAGLRLGFW